MKQALLIEKKDFTENYSRKITSAPQKYDCFLVVLVLSIIIWFY